MWVGMVTFGALGMGTLRELPWPEYERALARAERYAKQRGGEDG